MTEATAAPSRGGSDTLRNIAAVVLIVLGAVCITAAVPAVWGRNLVLNTDRYVETLKPLATDPGIQQAVIKAIDEQFAANINVADLVHQAFPGRGGTLLAGPLQNAATGLVDSIATKFVESDVFETLWVTINRVAHTALADILTGDHASSDALNVRNGVLTLSLAPVIDKVKAQLVAAGLSVAANVPAVGATLQIADVKGLTKAQSMVSLLDDLADWLPWIALLCFALAVLAAHRRRRAVVISALSTALGMLLLAIGIIIGRHVYLNSLPLKYLTAQDAGNLFDTLVRFLRTGLRIVFLVALLICLIAWVTGASRSARAIRSGVASGARRITAPSAGSTFANSVAEYRTPIAVGVVSLAALVLVLWTNPGALAVLIVALVTVVLVVLVYSFGSGSAGAAPATGAAPDATASHK